MLLAGFSTEGNGSSLTEAENVHMWILRTVSWSKAVMEISMCICPLCDASVLQYLGNL